LRVQKIPGFHKSAVKAGCILFPNPMSTV
jgi:hypothetical protein